MAANTSPPWGYRTAFLVSWMARILCEQILSIFPIRAHGVKSASSSMFLIRREWASDSFSQLPLLHQRQEAAVSGTVGDRRIKILLAVIYGNWLLEDNGRVDFSLRLSLSWGQYRYLYFWGTVVFTIMGYYGSHCYEGTIMGQCGTVMGVLWQSLLSVHCYRGSLAITVMGILLQSLLWGHCYGGTVAVTAISRA